MNRMGTKPLTVLKPFPHRNICFGLDLHLLQLIFLLRRRCRFISHCCLTWWMTYVATSFCWFILHTEDFFLLRVLLSSLAHNVGGLHGHGHVQTPPDLFLYRSESSALTIFNFIMFYFISPICLLLSLCVPGCLSLSLSLSFSIPAFILSVSY